MAGSISLSLSQQFDSLGEPLNGGFLQFYAAGTTTPQSAYQDVALTIPWPNPIVLDAAGRVPPFYLADGQIKIRLSDSSGVTQVAADNLLVIGASSGAGSPPSVDATTVFTTGDLKSKYGTGTITGWVRANGRTIGSATSGASELAATSAQTLFEYLWGADAGLAVSTGRGISANADWVANKTIVLPDWRGRVIAGFDDMGNSAASRLTTATMSGTGIGGANLGTATETRTILTANLPPYTPTGTVVLNTLGLRTRGGAPATSNDAIGLFEGNTAQTLSSPNNGTLVSSSLTYTGVAQGGVSTAFPMIQPTMFATIYIKT